MFRFLGKLPTLSFPHFSFNPWDDFSVPVPLFGKKNIPCIYNNQVVYSAWNFLQHFLSLGRCCFPRVWSHLEWKAQTQESRMPDCEIFLVGSVLCWSLWEWLLLMYRVLWESCVSSVHGGEDLKHKTLWAINTVSSSIQSSCICLPLVLQPHQSAAPIALQSPEELSGAESLLLTQPSCPGMLVSSSAATAWRKMKAFPLHPWVTCVHRECSLEDKSLEKSYIEYSQTRSWSLELFGYDTVLTLFLWTHPHTTIKRTDWKPLFNGWWLLLLALQISFGKSLHTKPFYLIIPVDAPQSYPALTLFSSV